MKHKKRSMKYERERDRNSFVVDRISTKKSLGQHFLSSPAYLKAIADAAHVAPGDTVLEIGPGEGTLTRELLACGARVIVVEKDRRLIPLLQEKFAAEILSGKLVVVEADALEFDPASHQLKAGRYKLLGNIPYYITGALFKKFLSQEPKPATLVFLIQKEVAQRIAKEKKESILSLSVKAYGTPRYVTTVPRGAFRPAPKVDSAILAVETISTRNFTSQEHEKRFFEIVRAGFSKKRKLALRNLEEVVKSEAFREVGVPLKARAEDISLAQWLLLAKE